MGIPAVFVALAASLSQAVLGVSRATQRSAVRHGLAAVQLRVLTAYLHLLQPLARLIGRIRQGLTPWRARRVSVSRFPRAHQQATMVSGAWESPQEKLTNLERALLRAGAVVRRGGEFARWDLELQGGLLGGARVLLSVEDLCPGQQLVRFRSWPALRSWGLVLFMVLVLLAVGASVDHAWIVGVTLGLAGLALLLRTLTEAAYSQSTLLQLLNPAQPEPEPEPEPELVTMVGRSGPEGTS